MIAFEVPAKDDQLAFDASDEWDAQFEALWKRYPKRHGNKGNKVKARRYFCRNLKSGEMTVAKYEIALDRYIKLKTETGNLGTEFVHMATTWFNSICLAELTLGRDIHKAKRQSLIERLAREHGE